MLEPLRRPFLILVSASLIAMVSVPLFAEESEPVSAGELRQAFYEALVAVEKASGRDSSVSDAFYWPNSDIEQALDAVPNKKAFLDALTGIKHRSLAARITDNRVIQQMPSPTDRFVNGTPPVDPNYPDPYWDEDYQMLLLLGLAPSPAHSRCEGTTLAMYQAALYGASISLGVAEMACVVAGCDPTGIACASFCGAYEIVNFGFKVFKEPVEYCERWAAKLDAAENEAAFRNSEIILGDLDAHDSRIVSMLQDEANATDDLAAALVAHDTALDQHDTRIVGLLASAASTADDIAAALAAHDLMVRAALDVVEANLAAHDGKISASLGQHDGDIKAILAQMLSTVVANQEEIIKLLKTPEGKRPGWGKEGY